jgi:hypothetical protein
MGVAYSKPRITDLKQTSRIYIVCFYHMFSRYCNGKFVSFWLQTGDTKHPFAHSELKFEGFEWQAFWIT